jgi:hypothetical protein
MLKTGKFPPTDGCKGLDTKALNPKPLRSVLELELPQETKNTLARMRTAIPPKTLFKLGTPKSMKDSNLDAKERIITELHARILLLPPNPA